MKQELSLILDDIRNGRHTESYVALFLAMIALTADLIAQIENITVLAASKSTAQTTIFQSIANALVPFSVIFLLTAILYSQIRTRQEYDAIKAKQDQLTETQIQTREQISELQNKINNPGLYGYFSRREQLPKLSQVLTDTQEEVYILGIQLGDIVHNQLTNIQKYLAEGKRINLAFLNPFKRDGSLQSWVDELGYVHFNNNLSESIRANLKKTKDWLDSLPAEYHEQVSVRLYSYIPTAAVILVDVDRPYGYIHIEPILHRVEPSKRFSIWLRASDDREQFAELTRNYKSLWDSAIPLEQISFNVRKSKLVRKP